MPVLNANISALHVPVESVSLHNLNFRAIHSYEFYCFVFNREKEKAVWYVWELDLTVKA